MRDETRSQFGARLLQPERSGEGDDWAFVVLPSDASARLPRRGRTTVEGTLDGHPFQALLEPDGQRGHWLQIDEPLLRASGARVGKVARFDLRAVDKVGEGASAFTIRRAHAGDVDPMFEVRGATRQSPFSAARLATRGITPALLAEAMASDSFGSWVGEVEGTVVGFCNADAVTGEVLVLAVRDGFEGRGIGRALLTQAVAFLRSSGCPRLWLMAGTSPELRAHGFYRAFGWVPTGRTDEYDDEELTLPMPDPAAASH